jgi:hypothetical protein
MTDDLTKLTLALPLSNSRSFSCVPLRNSKSDLYEAPSASKLMGLPPELHVLLFSYFDRCTSTCLGLTSKYFYATHCLGETKSYLSDSCNIPNPISRWCPKTIYLFELLHEWVGQDMCYVKEEQKFWNIAKWKAEVIEMEKRRALRKARREEEERMAADNMQRQCEICGEMKARRDSWP